MVKWKTVRVKQELLTAVERTVESGRYSSLAEFVSEAVQMRLNELRKGEKVAGKEADYVVVRERLLCSPDHMWAMVTPEGNIRVGLSDFAQRLLKGVADVHLEPVGCEVKRGKLLGSVETWMFKFDLRAPVSGKIARVNGAVLEKPSVMTEDSYDAGWIAEIKPDNVVTLEEELRNLMGPEQYRMYALKQRSLRRSKR